MPLLLTLGPCMGAGLYETYANEVTALFAAPRDANPLRVRDGNVAE